MPSNKNRYSGNANNNKQDRKMQSPGKNKKNGKGNRNWNAKGNKNKRPFEGIRKFQGVHQMFNDYNESAPIVKKKNIKKRYYDLNESDIIPENDSESRRRSGDKLQIYDTPSKQKKRYTRAYKRNRYTRNVNNEPNWYPHNETTQRNGIYDNETITVVCDNDVASTGTLKTCNPNSGEKSMTDTGLVHLSSELESDSFDAFTWLLNPVVPADFMSKYWEKELLYVDRNNPDFYNLLTVSTEVIDAMLKEQNVLFGKNIDVTTYIDGVRETHNPVGRAHAHIVWDFFKNGCSIRLLNPQTFIHNVYKVSELLQKSFNCFVGANLYLTPANSQGFAPHYDDIEAFVLQIQGRKYWKIYRPRNENEELPRYSSHNFTDEDIGEPIFEVELKPGDMLYFPRGFIHQASTRDELSLHITLSAYQCNAYVDLLEKLLPETLSKAASADVEFRKGLPTDYSLYFGLAPTISKSEESLKRRADIKYRVLSLLSKVLDHVDLDTVIDNFASKRLHDQLPPYFKKEDKGCMVFENSTRLCNNNKMINLVQLQMSSNVRLSNPSACRLVKSDNKYLLYFSINNSLEYHGNDEEFLELPEYGVHSFQLLCKLYPKYVRISNLPITEVEDRWSFANSLWEVGLLRTDLPIEPIKTDFTQDADEVEKSGNEKEV